MKTGQMIELISSAMGVFRTPAQIFKSVHKEALEDLGKVREALVATHSPQDPNVPVLQVDVEQIYWEDETKNYGDYSIEILGGSFHMELFRVGDEPGHGFVSAYIEDDDQMSKVVAVEEVMSDSGFSTVEIGGLNYVVIITPFDR
jgi:hypothetical protein